MTRTEVVAAMAGLHKDTRETLEWAIERGHLTWTDCEAHTPEEFPRWATIVAGGAKEDL